MKKPKTPERIICLTEESVELLYLLGEEQRIVGVSQFAVRPKQVKKEKPVVSVFTHSNREKVLNLKPDLIIGYSDIQKDIARDFIEAGQNVWIANHRSLQEVMDYCFTLANAIGASSQAQELFSSWFLKIEEAKAFAQSLKKRPRIYIEEWDDPRISGIRYFSELIELCGGVDINSHLRDGFLAKERFSHDDHVISSNPDLILACWCGKKVDVDQIKKRKGWENMDAIKEDNIFELPPEIFLQPGPALFEEGIDYLMNLFQKWQ